MTSIPLTFSPFVVEEFISEESESEIKREIYFAFDLLEKNLTYLIKERGSLRIEFILSRKTGKKVVIERVGEGNKIKAKLEFSQ